MIGKQIGYIRVSSIDQNPDRQLEGYQLDRKFIDTASGQNLDRPQLTAMLDYIRDGDMVLVHSMDRLARNLEELRKIVSKITVKQASVKFCKEGLIFTGDDSPSAQLMLSVMGAFGEFERSLIKERQREGIALAKKRGAYKGRKPSLSPEQVQDLKTMAASGVNKTIIAASFSISRETVYQYLRK